MKMDGCACKPLGLQVFVMQDFEMVEPRLGYVPDPGTIDADGHVVLYEMDEMLGEALVRCSLRQGMAPRYAAAILRKLADLVAREGNYLLNCDATVLGVIGSKGQPIEDPLSHQTE